MAKTITQAVILTAGYGSRLRPFTETTPKVMMPIGGRPLLAHTVEYLKSQGITHFLMNLHYLPQQITSYFGDGSRFGVEIRYSDEMDRLMDTAGGIKKMEPWLDENFLVHYGDRLHRFDFYPAVKLHFDRGAIATLVLKPVGPSDSGEAMEFDKANGRVTGYHVILPGAQRGTQSNMGLLTGLYVMSKKVLAYVPKDTPVHMDKQTIPELLERGLPVYGYPTDKEILDIATLEHYQAAEEWFQSVVLNRIH